MDRLMNDTNRIWNKSFRDPNQQLTELNDSNPFMGLLMNVLSGVPVTKEELQKALDTSPDVNEDTPPEDGM